MKNSTEGEGDVVEKPQLRLVTPPEENNFILELKESRSFKQKNAAFEMTYKVKLNNTDPGLLLNNLLPNLQALFDTLLDHTREQYGDEGVGRIYINHPKLESAIIVRPKYLWELSGTEILQVIDEVLYSAGQIPADDELDINIAIVKLMKGSGRRAIRNVQEDTKAKRCFVTIQNDDLMCLPRAIVVGLARLLHKKNEEDVDLKKFYDKIRKKGSKLQEEEALFLLLRSGLPVHRSGISSDIPVYENILGISICLFSAQTGNRRVYNGNTSYEDKIFLYHYENEKGGHFDVLTEVNQLMCTSYYCDDCGKGFKNSTQHKCSNWCNICGTKCLKGLEKVCETCNRTCRSMACYIRHKKVKKIDRGNRKGQYSLSLCEQYWDCPKCGVTLQKINRSPNQHECGEIRCPSCNEYFLHEDHLCYMRSTYNEREVSKFIFYDFECYVKDNVHIPNYVIAITVCDKCRDDSFTEESACSICGSRCLLCNKFNKKEKEYEHMPCNGCGKRMTVFKGENTKKNFCKWLLEDEHSDFTAIAHNSKAYDAYFIYDYLLENSITPEPIIFSGSKIMYMKIGRSLNLRIIDSLNFLPMPLANFPKTFELKELKKGFFPYFFNTPENENIILTNLPEIKYYDPDSMSIERRQEFLKWYSEHENDSFNMCTEIHEYCLSDVKILMEGCLKFRDLVMSVTGDKVFELNLEEMMYEEKLQNSIDPFSFLTIASVCLGIFRSNFLQESWKVLTMQEHYKNSDCDHETNCKCVWLKGRKVNAKSPIQVLFNGEWIDTDLVSVKKAIFVSSPLALIPHYGYNKPDNHSLESLQWLAILERNYKEKGYDIEIQHARNSKGEKIISYVNQNTNRITRYKADGYFEIGEKKYICEFNGCNWHGCPRCFIRDREVTINNGKSLGQRYRETLVKEQRLKEMGYVVLTKWSCEFKADLVRNPYLQSFLDEINIVAPLNIRDSYFGGRTNALTLYKKFENGEKGSYFDFCSLYPDVLKYKKYPIGHPQKIIQGFKPIQYVHCDDPNNCEYSHCPGYHSQFPYFGIVKAKILPPQHILHPVLPVRCNGKLKFPLCYKCAELNMSDVCECNDEERSFIQTYCSNEVEVALNMGYKIIEIYEVLHWEHYDMYDISDQQGGLFTNYINTFLKIKQESSGLPDDVNKENIEEYIEKYYKHEGISMTCNNIKKNPGLRGVSKLALNSFYGKFGQRTNMKKTKIITDVGILYNTLTDRSKDIVDFHIMNENVMEVEFKNSADFEPLSKKTNIVIATFCTAWARLKLWFAMNKLGERVLYHDTDSIIFSTTSEQQMPELGNYLGELTDELSCKNLGCKIYNCEGHWIEEFISCGPKNYSYKLNSGQTITKVRGFSLNFSSSEIINFDTMKDCLDSWIAKDNRQVKTIKTEIRRNKFESRVFSRKVEKHYGVVYDKRVVTNNYKTVPYGYRKNTNIM